MPSQGRFPRLTQAATHLRASADPRPAEWGHHEEGKHVAHLFAIDPLTRQEHSHARPKAPLPDDVYDRLTGRASVLNQSIKVDATRWQETLRTRNLPMPVGKLADSEWVTLSRAAVFAVADQEPSPDAALSPSPRATMPTATTPEPSPHWMQFRSVAGRPTQC